MRLKIMKKLISIILSALFILNLSAPVSAKELEELYTGPSQGFFISKTIPEFEKTVSDFFTKYPNKNSIKDDEIRREYDVLTAVKSDGILLPKKFKDNMDCLTGISPSASGDEKSVILFFKKDNISYSYVIDYNVTPDTEWYSVKNQAKYADKTKAVNGTVIYREKYKEGAPISYFWASSDGRYRSFDIRTVPDGDYFDYCDMYEYKLNLSNELSAGEGIKEISVKIL